MNGGVLHAFDVVPGCFEELQKAILSIVASFAACLRRSRVFLGATEGDFIIFYRYLRRSRHVLHSE